MCVFLYIKSLVVFLLVFVCLFVFFFWGGGGGGSGVCKFSWGWFRVLGFSFVLGFSGYVVLRWRVSGFRFFGV